MTTTETTAAAKVQISESAGTLRLKVLAFLHGVGKCGATDDEIQTALGMGGNTERPRRRELQRAGNIQDSGRTRLTTSGRRAVVWVAS